jgi:hypothetical protein
MIVPALLTALALAIAPGPDPTRKRPQPISLNYCTVLASHAERAMRERQSLVPLDETVAWIDRIEHELLRRQVMQLATRFHQLALVFDHDRKRRIVTLAYESNLRHCRAVGRK